MCSPSLNKYSQVLFITCARSQRERGCKKKYDESRVEFFSLVFFSQPDEASFPHFFFPKKLLCLAFSQASAPSIRPKWPRPPPKRRLTNKFQREKSVSSGNSSTQTPLKRVSLSLSLSLYRIEPKAKKEEGTERARSLSLDGVVFFALLLLLFRARREFTRLEMRKRRKTKKREEEDDDYSTECDDEGPREHQRGGEKDIRLRPTLG